MTTGTIFPAIPCVAALKALQKSMMFKPLEPSAGPTGGAGLAAPPLIWSLMNPVTSFAIIKRYSLVTCVKLSSRRVFLPKITTITLTLLLSSRIASTVPLNPLNGPSVMRTASPTS